MIPSVIGWRLLVVHAVLSSAACLAQGVSPSQFAPSPAALVERRDTVTSPCQAITDSKQQLAPLGELCRFAVIYQQQLPDFIAHMTVTETHLRSTTVVDAQVTFSREGESYSAMTVNGEPVETGEFKNIPAALMRFASSGEFGSSLVDLFQPGAAEFQFHKHARLRGKPVVVYDFHVSTSSHASWILADGSGHSLRSESRGELWVEAATGRLLREIEEPVHIPAGFEIVSAKTSIDYTETTVGDAGVFLLPSRSESSVCTRQPFLMRLSCFTNVKNFVNYRKFVATTRILAGAPLQ